MLGLASLRSATSYIFVELCYIVFCPQSCKHRFSSSLKIDGNVGCTLLSDEHAVHSTEVTLQPRKSHVLADE